MFIVNFVMSSYTESTIFQHIIQYFKKYSVFKIIQTLKPLENADIYYYFRPHLENKLRKNSIVTVHHDLKETDINLNINFFIERYRQAKLVVCLNTMQQNILLFEYGIKHTVVIPHGYNEQILKYSQKEIKNKFTIGIFSNYYPRLVKGEEYLLKFSNELSVDEIKFILVGNKRRILCKELLNLGFECRVYEFLPYWIFNFLYKQINLLLITSKFEGGPASLPESLATGTPVLTTNVGMVNDFSNYKGVFLLKENLMEDKEKLEFIKINFININDSIRQERKNYLLTWKEVIKLYDIEFQNFNNKFQSNYLSFLFLEFSYKLRTLYLKKKFFLMFNGIKDIYKLLFKV